MTLPTIRIESYVCHGFVYETLDALIAGHQGFIERFRGEGKGAQEMRRGEEEERRRQSGGGGDGRARNHCRRSVNNESDLSVV